jgi:mannose-6-phosphate isomerase-like protein (cupin superfamily)
LTICHIIIIISNSRIPWQGSIIGGSGWSIGSLHVVNIRDLVPERVVRPKGTNTEIAVRLPFPDLQGTVDPNWFADAHRRFLCVVPTFPVGTTAGHHQHVGTEEIYLILSGQAAITVDDETSPVRPGDVIWTMEASFHHLHDVIEPLTFVAVETRATPRGASIARGSDRSEVGGASRGTTVGREDDLMNIVNVNEITPRHFRPPGADKDVTVRFPFPERQGTLDPHWFRDPTRRFQLTVVTYPVHATAGHHRHEGMEELYFILSGWGSVTVDGETRDIGPGDVILTQDGSSHQLHDITEELTFIALELRTTGEGRLTLIDSAKPERAAGGA